MYFHPSDHRNETHISIVTKWIRVLGSELQLSSKLLKGKTQPRPMGAVFLSEVAHLESVRILARKNGVE
jgi:hypothetical protein